MVAWARLGPVKQRHDNAGKGTQHCVITPELCRSYTRVNHVNLASVPIVLLTQLTAVPQELVNVPPPPQNVTDLFQLQRTIHYSAPPFPVNLTAEICKAAPQSKASLTSKAGLEQTVSVGLVAQQVTHPLHAIHVLLVQCKGSFKILASIMQDVAHAWHAERPTQVDVTGMQVCTCANKALFFCHQSKPVGKFSPLIANKIKFRRTFLLQPGQYCNTGNGQHSVQGRFNTKVCRDTENRA
jgi:hypothetical protein